MCFLPRLLVPIVAHLVYRAIGKGRRGGQARGALAAAAGSLTNTIFYLGLMLLFYVMMGIDSGRVLALIGGTGLIAGSIEAVFAALIATPVLAALWKVQKKN